MSRPPREDLRPVPRRDLRLGEVMWDYLRVEGGPETSEIVLVMGSPDVRVARHAATLMRAGLAAGLVVSGGRPIAGHDGRPEVEVFGAAIVEAGVDPELIVLEPGAQHTSDHFWRTDDLLGEQPRSAILCCAPIAERRALATGRLRWHGTRFSVGGLPHGFHAYLRGAEDPAQVLSWMVGEVERILEYPRKGFMSEPDVPPGSGVIEAYRSLRPIYDQRPLPMRARGLAQV